MHVLCIMRAYYALYACCSYIMCFIRDPPPHMRRRIHACIVHYARVLCTIRVLFIYNVLHTRVLLHAIIRTMHVSSSSYDMHVAL